MEPLKHVAGFYANTVDELTSKINNLIEELSLTDVEIQYQFQVYLDQEQEPITCYSALMLY